MLLLRLPIGGNFCSPDGLTFFFSSSGASTIGGSFSALILVVNVVGYDYYYSCFGCFSGVDYGG